MKTVLDAMTEQQANKVRDGLSQFFNAYNFTVTSTRGLYAVTTDCDKNATCAKMTVFAQGVCYGMSH